MPNFRPGLGDDTGRYIRCEHGYIEYRYAPGNLCEIVNIEVSNEHRREGVGRKLLSQLFKEIAGKADRVYAITTVGNEIAQQFYESCGFEVVNPLRRFYAGERAVDAMMYVRDRRGPV